MPLDVVLEPGVVLPHLHAVFPRGHDSSEHAERGDELARGLAANRVADDAPDLHVVDPLGLRLHERRDTVACWAGAGKLALRRQIDQGQPVVRRVDFGGGARRRCGDGGQRQRLPGADTTGGESTSPYPRTHTL